MEVLWYFVNNFANNTVNVYTAYDTLGTGNGTTMPPWDNGYPVGGNYWKDYFAKYPNAVELNSSGIGNTPYVVHTNPNIIDRYPLINSIDVPEVVLTSPSPSTSTSPSPSSSPSSSPNLSPSPSQEPSQSPEPNSTTLPLEYIYVAAAIIAIAIIAAIAIILKRRT